MSTIIILILLFLIGKHLDKKIPPGYHDDPKHRKAAEDQIINGIIMLEDENDD